MKRLTHKIYSITFTLSLTLFCSTSFASSSLPSWVTMSDYEFATTYEDIAFSSDIKSQSKFAWMLFLRINQQQALNGTTFSEWELWPSNQDTFSPNVGVFKSENKVRTRPHLQQPKIQRILGNLSGFTPNFPGAGEEVTRNTTSYNYIINNRLNTKAGVKNKITSSSPKVDFPIGTIEIKADWAVNSPKLKGTYQITDPDGVTYSLVGLHIMAKVRPAPADPFHSEETSWFWTTFEFKNNPGLKNAQSLISYPDELSNKKIKSLFKQAALDNTPFVNYSSNGTQIRYSDKKHANIILGNTKMEAFAGVPANSPPSQWTAWNSSCHTCHGTASANASLSINDPNFFYPFTVEVGKLTDPRLNQYTSMDFVWSIPFHAQ